MKDLIERHLAERRIDEALSRVFTKTSDSIGKQILDRIPSAQPEQRWIPCSERLPEGGRVVLVTEKGGFIRHCEYANYCDFQEFQTVEEGLTVHDVIAWMPLPKQYKGEES